MSDPVAEPVEPGSALRPVESASPVVPVSALTRGRVSVVRLPDQWFIVATSAQLKRKPLPVTLQGVPLVLFRNEAGQAAALLDRCPHRNVPLSLGRVQHGELECAYHGWRFDGSGACRAIPSLVGSPEGKARRAPSYPTLEQEGMVWVYSTPDVEPTSTPYRFPLLDRPGYSHARQVVDSGATVYATAENALDVPHTAFLHRGLFRSESRGITITAVVRRQADRVEAEYVGEPRPPGLVGRLLEERHRGKLYGLVGSGIHNAAADTGLASGGGWALSREGSAKGKQQQGRQEEDITHGKRFSMDGIAQRKAVRQARKSVRR